jgi:peptidoglycan/LPS O-acetylase OafA/YrhL
MGAFLPTQLDLFLIGIGSYHLFAWAQGRGSSSAPRIDRLVLVAFAGALVSEIHSVALQIWVVAFGAGFVSGRDLFSRALRTIRALLLHPALQYLGRWSYPLYLIHWPLVILGYCLLVDLSPDINSRHALPLMLAAGLPLIVMAAALLHYAIEAPLMRLGRRLTHRKVIPSSHVDLQKIT